MIHRSGRKARPLRAALSIVVALAGTGALSLESASGAVTLSASPTTVTAGTSLFVLWGNIPNPTIKDWVGLYATPQALDTKFVAFRYTDSTKATGVTDMPFLVPRGTRPLDTYQFRLFSNDSFARLATSGPVTIEDPGTTLSTAAGSVAAGSSKQVIWSRIAAPTPTDWIGLYGPGAADTAFIAFRYTESTIVNGNEQLAVPAGTPPGSTYQIRLFSNDTFTRLAVSNLFQVT